MTNDHGHYDCIDPELGEELWRLADPATDPAQRARLETHVTFCAACRQQLAIEQAVVRGLETGELTVRASHRRGPARWFLTGGGLAAAAGMSLMLLLPPSPPSTDVVRGTGAGERLVRPVEDEVVLGDQARLRWTPVAGATAYRVRVQSVGSGQVWEERVEGTATTVGDDRALPVGERFRVMVATVPAHAGASVDGTFSTAGLGAFLGYRALAGALVGQVLGAVGVLGALLGLGLVLRRR